MKKACENLFIELVSPYLTALEAARKHKVDDWHGVFAFAETLCEEMKTDFIVGELNPADRDHISQLALKLSDIAINQESRILQHAQPSDTNSTEAMALVGQIQGKLRAVIIDNVCACESGPKITAYQVGKFPKQDKALKTIEGLGGPVNITHVHDDGDLTVQSDVKSYVVTIEGDIFSEQKT